MNPRANKHLHDIAVACRKILDFTEGLGWQEFHASDLLRSAVERQFEILGEASVRLRNEDRKTFDGIGEAASIVGLRNRLAHGYDSIDDAIIWSIVQEKIPDLLRTVEALLQDL